MSLFEHLVWSKLKVNKQCLSLLALCLMPFAQNVNAEIKVCSLLTPSEIASVGVKISANALIVDGPTPLKKGAIPGLSTDLLMYQCTGEFSKNFAAFLVRWDLALAKDALDKKAWKKLNETLDNGEKKDPGSNEKLTVISGTECSEFSWAEKKGGKRIYAVNCGEIKGKQMVSLEFANDDQKKLPSVSQVKQLLDKMLARL
jgi:hypothetical protein